VTPQQIAILLRNPTLSSHEREQLLQLQHYMTAEGTNNSQGQLKQKFKHKHNTNTKPKS